MAASSHRLAKNLTLADVYSIATGPMFAGFFLLPGIAYAISGAWMILAFFVAAMLIVPALLSKAELASAMPKAGGTYYFLDRSMGPLVGTVGGLGTWIALGLKNTFALIGMGAYISLFVDVDMIWVAIGLAVFFGALNIFGAKETARLQRIMVTALVAILSLFIISGFWTIGKAGFASTISAGFRAAPATTTGGVLATIGMVIVSYAGLTKVAGIVEEVKDPDRDLRRGMLLAIATSAIMYAVGAFLLVVLLPPAELSGSLTPIADAVVYLFDWLPTRVAMIGVLVAAVAAFAATANAGIMAASRYLMAMGRDGLVPEPLSHLGRFRTPTIAVMVTVVFIILALMTLDVVSVAKLASAFQLLVFAFVNLAVIVMRESGLVAYEPTVPSPFYPWMQVFGIFAGLFLIVEMGRMPMFFTMGLVALTVAWFFWYAKPRVVRAGAIRHWFERLGRDRFDALEAELRLIIKEKHLEGLDPLDDIVNRAMILDIAEETDFDTAAARCAALLAPRVHMTVEAVAEEFLREERAVPYSRGIALPHFRAADLSSPEMVVVRAPVGVHLDLGDDHPTGERDVRVHALFFLVGSAENAAEHLELLARLARLTRRPDFLETWLEIKDMNRLRKALSDDDDVWELAEALVLRHKQNRKEDDDG